MNRTLFIALGSTMLLASIGNAAIPALNWGTGPNQANTDSNGNPLDNTWTFQLGTFIKDGALWEPDTKGADWQLWDDYWLAADSTPYAPITTDPPNPLLFGAGSFGNAYDPNADPAYVSSFQGKQAYIFGFKDDGSGKPSEILTEWVVFTDFVGDGADAGNNPWVFPSDTGAEHPDDLLWRLGDPERTVLVGSADDGGNPINLQTEVLVPIPEPGSATLLLLGFLGAIARRRR